MRMVHAIVTASDSELSSPPSITESETFVCVSDSIPSYIVIIVFDADAEGVASVLWPEDTFNFPL